MLTNEQVERFARHVMLREIGGPGQARLRNASAVMVGMGGLGAPAALYLAAAGFGRLRLIDPDHVALSNLQRQVLYATKDVGRLKVEVAAERLGALNPDTAIAGSVNALQPANAIALLDGFDVILDGTDDFATRFAVNDACLALGAPLVSGAVGRWSGQVGVFGGPPGPDRPACYRCLTPELPPDVETCAETGIVGALTGVIGAMMAMEAIKIVAKAGAALSGRLLIYDGLSAEARVIAVPRDPACPACAITP